LRDGTSSAKALTPVEKHKWKGIDMLGWTLMFLVIAADSGAFGLCQRCGSGSRTCPNSLCDFSGPIFGFVCKPFAASALTLGGWIKN
jgi:hypothetical protein